MFSGSSPAPASAPFVYERHRPEATTLYAVVRDNLETLYGAVDEGAIPITLPGFVRKELEGYLDCGLLCRGFAHLKCESLETLYGAVDEGAIPITLPGFVRKELEGSGHVNSSPALCSTNTSTRRSFTASSTRATVHGFSIPNRWRYSSVSCMPSG